MIPTEREQLQAITTPFSCHLPENWIFAHFGYFWPFMPAHGWPLDPTSLFIDINIIIGYCCNEIYRKKATPGYYNSIFLPFAKKIKFLVIFGHFLSFVPAHGWPLDPTSAFISKNVITGCCHNEIYGEKATPGYYNLIFLPFAWKFNFCPFLAIFHHLCLLMGNPLIAPLLLLTNTLSLGAFAMISTKRDLQ